MTIEEKRRALFEAYVKTANPDDYAEHGDSMFEWNGAAYAWSWVNLDWMLWNAALDAVVIELPGELIDWDEIGMARNVTLKKCRAAIESTGLGIKVLP